MHHIAAGRHSDPSSRLPVYGALDLGTNNCRLLMAVPVGEGFRVVEAFSRPTRLGEGLARSGRLSDDAMRRTIAALGECAKRLSRRGVGRLRAVATEACRRAVNCNAFLEQVAAATGLAMEIISAEEEAHLALAGCAPLLSPTPADALVFDIGGGSTELVRVRMNGAGFDVVAFESLPFGVVTLAEDPALLSEGGFAATVDAVERRLAAFDKGGDLRRLALAGSLQMLGTSGTVTTLAGVHLGLVRYDRARVDGLVMEFSSIAAVSRRLVDAATTDRVAHPCIGEDRADLVVSGCAILGAICRHWPAGRLRVADRGVREGLLLSMMRADAQG